MSGNASIRFASASQSPTSSSSSRTAVDSPMSRLGARRSSVDGQGKAPSRDGSLPDVRHAQQLSHLEQMANARNEGLLKLRRSPRLRPRPRTHARPVRRPRAPLLRQAVQLTPAQRPKPKIHASFCSGLRPRRTTDSVGYELRAFGMRRCSAGETRSEYWERGASCMADSVA